MSGVRVVVVAWNSAKTLGGMLETLADGLQGIDNAEIVIVDNGSSDNTSHVAAETTPQARILRSEINRGYAGGINLGSSDMPRDQQLLILNDDVSLSTGSVRHLLNAIVPGVGIVVPRLLTPDGHTQHTLRREPSVVSAWAEALLGGRRAAVLGMGETLRRGYGRTRDVAWATGAALLVTAECRHAVGAWDESFFLYSEETDYMLRARDRGFTTRYCPDAVMTHIGGSLQTDPKLWALQVRNRITLHNRRHPQTAGLFRTGVRVNEFLRAAAGRSVHGLAQGETTSAPHGLVWFGAVDWWYHNQAHSELQLARHLARTRPVLFINSLGLRVPRRGRTTGAGRRWRRKLGSITRGLRAPLPQEPNFHVFTPFNIPGLHSGPSRSVMAAIVQAQVRFTMLRLRITEPDVIATIPTAVDVIRRMPHRSLTYNRSDLHSAFPEADQALIEQFESELLTESDHVLYASRELLTTERAQLAGRAHFLDHGVDLDLFTLDGPDPPEDMARIPGPRVGFIGGIDDYVVDLDLLDILALHLPEASLVLIGDATCSLDRFRSLPNVHVLGQRPHEQIPAYGRALDVALMPWLDNAWIRFCNPIKMKEYLALGLPIVTTAFPEAGGYRDVLHIAHDREEFVALTRHALAQPSSEQERRLRRQRVTGEAWVDKGVQLAAIIDSHPLPSPALYV